MATNRLSAARRELVKIEQRLCFRQRLTDRPVCIIVAFVTYSDGCVADCTNRPLSEWELLKGKQGIVTLDCRHEYSLRRGLTPVRQGTGIGPEVEPQEQRFDPASVPEAPATERLPWEIFMNWLSSQLAEMREKRQEKAENGTKQS